MDDGRGLWGSPPAGAVLVVDDHGPSWRAVQRLLEARGSTAQWASDGAEAVAMVAQSWFDLVLMDCHMPRLDGFDAARAIRRDEARLGTSRVPIVAVTADPSPETRSLCLAAGMDDHAVKPLGAEVLDGVLTRWLTWAGDAPAVDPERWAELRAAFSEGELRALLRDLAADVTSHLRTIEGALTGRSPGDIGHAAHQIANAASILGASALGCAARRLCQLADGRTGAAGELTAVSAAVTRRWEQTAAALAALPI